VKRAALAATDSLLPTLLSTLLSTLFSALLFALPLAVVAACSKKESTGTVVGPPLTYEPRDAGFPAAAASQPAEPASKSPVVAVFIDLQARGAPVKVRACEYVVVAVAKGHASTSGVELVAGDAAVFHGAGGFDVKGEGLALLAAIHEETCPAPSPEDRMSMVVVKASRAPDLAWAGGKMHAHLDVQAELGKTAYVGRLEVGAPVPEHQHDASWEVLAAIEGKGTLTVDGKPIALEPRSVVAIPPATKHAFVPAGGSRLVALQIYTPPGPEERFKALAAPAGDAATSPPAK
jgi:mannose-6-phosphate isomerase-like protein (cupin superfamily)